MTMWMGMTVNQFKVIKRVIQLVSINMMNKFLGRQFSAQFNFHNGSVFQNNFIISSDNFISLGTDCTFTMCSFFPKVWIAISVPSKIVSITHSTFLRFFLAIKALFHKKQYMIDTTICQEGILNNRMNSGKPVTGYAVGNPEPSRGCTLGRCRDYWRGLVLLITSLSVRHESDEIVQSS